VSWSDESDEASRPEGATNELPAPGWYDDPAGSGRERYWDGADWTERLSGEHEQPSPAEAPAPQRPSPLSGLPWRRIGVGTAVAAVLAGPLIGAWVLSRVVDDTDERLADTQSTLEDTRGELADAKSQIESLNQRAEKAEKERDDLAEQVTQLTGEEQGATDLEGVKAVSKGKTLKLEELEATLVGYELSDTVSDEFDTRRADGKFVTLTVTVTNRLSSPQTLDPQEHFSLVIDGQEFTPDFDAMNYAGGDKSWLDIGLNDLQPGTAKTGTVTFDVSPKAAKSAAEGTLLLVQFSDASAFDEEPSLPIAGLKLG
jgi:Domain of unknown function (DUF4352)/Protein of unknown function (DUF2510)